MCCKKESPRAGLRRAESCRTTRGLKALACGVLCFVTAGVTRGAVEAQPASIGLASRQTIDYRFDPPSVAGFKAETNPPKAFEFAGDSRGTTNTAEMSTLAVASLDALLPKTDSAIVAASPSDQRDHLISQAVTDTSKAANGPFDSMLLFWNANTATADFAQMLADAKTAGVDAREPEGTVPLLIPLPKALWTGLSGLIGLGAVAAWRRRSSCA